VYEIVFPIIQDLPRQDQCSEADWGC
jgi:hypothetical protein